MSEKLKLTTYIHENIPPSARKTKGFRDALNFLNDLYKASEDPTYDFHSSSDEKRRRVFKSGWAHISGAFYETTRASSYINPDGSNFFVEVSFHKGEETKWHRIEVIFDPSGKILDATLGDWHA